MERIYVVVSCQPSNGTPPWSCCPVKLAIASVSMLGVLCMSAGRANHGNKKRPFQT